MEAGGAKGRSQKGAGGWWGGEPAELAQIMPSLRRVFPELPPLQLPPHQARRELFHSMTSVLQRAAGAVPLFLIFEDLQWADEATMALFQHLANRVASLPVVLLGTY